MCWTIFLIMNINNKNAHKNSEAINHNSKPNSWDKLRSRYEIAYRKNKESST